METSSPVVKILVLQRGWIVVGEYERAGEYDRLTRAATIRRWGTTKGLGEIAMGGPTQATILDPCGTVEAHVLTRIVALDCNAEAWAKYLR